MSDSLSTVSILGSTGSIGVNSLEVIRNNPNQFQVLGLTCNNNIELLAAQVKEFKPNHVSVGLGKSESFKNLLGENSKDLKIYEGLEGHCRIAALEQTDKVVASIMGADGLKPILQSIQKGNTVAIANKEPVVLAGSILMKEAAKSGAQILPLDSEHNAIFQALQGSQIKDVETVTLTASGGPFLNTDRSKFKEISVERALKHPNWEMGRKISIDSATMMNKALEIIEAKWLFSLKAKQIKVVVHPQSIIHSLVNYKDGSSIAQLGNTDMKVPIAYCLGYPERIASGISTINLSELAKLEFFEPDLNKFPTLALAYKALEICDGAPAILNGANEVLVELFLKEKISFDQIFSCLSSLFEDLERSMSDNTLETKIPDSVVNPKTIEQTIKADQWGRTQIFEMLNQ